MIEASVIIPTYNRAGRLRSCLEALGRQTQSPSDFEVVVIVDGSTDDTLDTLGRLQTPYSLRVFSQPNSGSCVARNRGAAEAQGRVCIFLDDDIIASPRLVAEHLSLHRQRERVVGIGQITLKLPPRADWFSLCFARSWSQHYEALSLGKRAPDWEDCYSGNVSVSRTELLEVGGFAPDLPYGHDAELGYRLQERGCAFVYLRDAVGEQDERKGFAALASDAEKDGAASVEIWRRHPPAFARSLGQFNEGKVRRNLLRRLLLTLHVSPSLLEPLGRLMGKSAFYLFRFLYAYSFWRGVRRALDDDDTWRRLTSCPTILMYHAFAAPGEPASRYIVPVGHFAAQMAWLKRRGYRVIGLQEYLQCRAENRLPPARSAIITIDDGYRDNWELAYPILKRYGFPATIFLVSSQLESTNSWDTEPGLSGRPMLSWSQVEEMRRGGIEVGAHTRTHPSLTDISPEQAQAEIAGSRNDLEGRLKAPVQTFAYPYGDYSSTVLRLVETAGFAGSCSVENGPNTPATPLHALRRVAVWGTDSLIGFVIALSFGARREVLLEWGKRW